MNYLEFRNKWYDLGIVNSNQIYSWKPGFDKNNLTRWTCKRLLIKLRNGYYAFPEYKAKSDFAIYIANRIYRPSYVSLHTALAFYGMIPESVVQITSVTSMKTATFTNVIGEFSYKSVRPHIFFGYDVKLIPELGSLLMAKPEKALLDLLYLYPFYNSVSDIEDLRLDMDYIHNEIDIQLLNEFSHRLHSKALDKRIKLIFL